MTSSSVRWIGARQLWWVLTSPYLATSAEVEHVIDKLPLVSSIQYLKLEAQEVVNESYEIWELQMDVFRTIMMHYEQLVSPP